MKCFNCGRTFLEGEEPTYAIIPGRDNAVPVCHDDRQCVCRPGQASPRMRKVQDIARRYAS